MKEAKFAPTAMPDAVDKVLILGDTHGNDRWTCAVIDLVAGWGLDGILQLGDFGYWPRDDWGKQFLTWTENTLAQYDMPLWFIDGNHEDHVSLKSAQTEPGPLKVTDHITYLPRGTRWVWDNRVWVALGGAPSVDRFARSRDVSWFNQETMTYGQQARIVAGGHADVVVAHDAPWGVKYLATQYKLWLPPTERGSWPPDALRDSDAHMAMMTTLALALTPDEWFHGHHHMKYDEDSVELEPDAKPLDVHGLSCDGTNLNESALVVDGYGNIIPWSVVEPTAE